MSGKSGTVIQETGRPLTDVEPTCEMFNAKQEVQMSSAMDMKSFLSLRNPSHRGSIALTKRMCMVTSWIMLPSLYRRTVTTEQAISGPSSNSCMQDMAMAMRRESCRTNTVHHRNSTVVPAGERERVRITVLRRLAKQDNPPQKARKKSQTTHNRVV
jgi:hypothetical protein